MKDMSIGRVVGKPLLAGLVFAFVSTVYCAVLPADRQIDWSYAGVPGGIPHRTVIYQSFSPGATAAQINSALASCPSNQVVFLDAGTYSLSSGLSITRNGVTLRGATNASGAPTTILNFAAGAGGDGLIDISGSYPANGNWSGVSSLSVNSGYTQGSTNIVLSGTPSGMTPGTIIVIDQITDEDKVRNTTTQQGSGVWGGRNNNRSYCQFLRVKSVSGSTVTFEPPIYGNYWAASQSPGVYWWGSSKSMIGIEDLEVNRTLGGGGLHNIHMALADKCWVRNVKSRQAQQGHVRFAWAMNCEIRDSYFTLHDSVGSATYSMYMTYVGSTLIQNNIGYDTPCLIGMGEVEGSVIAYNYGTNFPYSVSSWLPECVMLHGGHNYFNLFEGNTAPSFWADLIHGNASYITVHRNRFTGWELGKTGSLSPINMEDYQDYFSVVGNVLGTSGIQNSYSSIFDVVSSSANTLVRKGNYNFFNNGIPTSESLGTDTLVNSYYLSSKPSWFGDRPWPPIDPTKPLAAVVTNSPAGYRFIYGKFPTSGPVNNPPVVSASVSTNAGKAPVTVTFSSTGSYDPEGVALTYSWNFGDGTSTSTSANPSHTYATSGTFNARLTVSDGVNTSLSPNITINVTIAGSNYPPTVAASPTTTAGAVPLVVGFTSTASDPEGSTLSYNWNFGDGTSSTSANPSHTYQAVGVYSASLTVSDGTNSVTSSPISISVAAAGSGLQAAYSFEEGSGATVGDVSGKGNVGTVVNTTWTSNGKYGKAIAFGSGGMMTVNDSASLDLTSGMTLELWVYPTNSSATWANLIMKPNGAPSDAAPCYALNGSSPSAVPSAYISPATANLMAPTSLPVNTWSHVAVTYNGTQMNFYLNGVLVSSSVVSGAIGVSTDALTIGGNAYSGQNWPGLVDEVRIYNRALSATEILTDKSTPLVGGTVTTPTPPSAPQGLRVLVQ